ncbi:MAG: hypothetical protein LBS27_08615 [Bifidobacteriaceae bacterium]|nr:hypothetical protein [Bifidobacteriaceae bacterium]
MLILGCDANSASTSAEATVEFDYETMQIRLPLDQYGMVPTDERLFGAARLIEYRDCMAGEGVDPAWLESDESIRDILTSVDGLMPDWRFGFWNAGYVAEHGIDGPPPHEDAVVEPVSAEHDAALRDPQSPYNLAWAKCADSGAVAFVFVGRGVVSAKWEVFAQGFRESYDKARDDKRWESAHREWEECVAAKGYPSPEWLTSLVPEGVPEEVEAKSFVDDAQCADDLATAKKLAQVEAGYQMEYIAEHEAELVEIQRQTRALVAEAEALVEEAGFSW